MPFFETNMAAGEQILLLKVFVGRLYVLTERLLFTIGFNKKAYIISCGSHCFLITFHGLPVLCFLGGCPMASRLISGINITPHEL